MTNSNWNSDSPLTAIGPSLGGHLFLRGFILKLTDSSFSNATAYKGAGAYFSTVKDGRLSVSRVNFTWLLTPLKLVPESRGGCVYLDSSASQMIATFSEIMMNGCFARGEGGCIYVKPSANT
jgi:hypothetical protein